MAAAAVLHPSPATISLPAPPSAPPPGEITSLRAAADEFKRLTEATVSYICQVDEYLAKEREQLARERTALSSAPAAHAPPHHSPHETMRTAFLASTFIASARHEASNAPATEAAAALHDELVGADDTLRQLREQMKELDNDDEPTSVTSLERECDNIVQDAASSDSILQDVQPASAAAASDEGSLQQIHPHAEAPPPLLVLAHTNFQRPSGEWVTAADLQAEGGDVLLGPGGVAVFTSSVKKSAFEERDVVRMRMRMGDNVVLPSHEIIVEGPDGALQGKKAGELGGMPGPLPRLYDGFQFQHILAYEILREPCEIVQVNLDEGGAAVLLAWTMRKRSDSNDAPENRKPAAVLDSAAPSQPVEAPTSPHPQADAEAGSGAVSTPVMPFRDGSSCVPLSLLYACSLPVLTLDPAPPVA